jgi:hypothetical protein
MYHFVNVTVYQKISKNIQKYPKISKNIQKYPKISKISKINIFG